MAGVGQVSTDAAPAWAVEVCTSVARRHGIPLVTLHWASPKRDRRGFAYFDGHRIVIHAGVAKTDATLRVLLHELAHLIRFRVNDLGHSHQFWCVCFQLFVEYGVDLDAGVRESYLYKRGALVGARLAGVPIPADVQRMEDARRAARTKRNAKSRQ